MTWSASDIPDQGGRTAIVTGANSGIGFETAAALAGRGASVVLACRSRKRGDAALERLKERHPKGIATMMLLDLANPDSILRFADSFRDLHKRLDLLINNAGVMAPPYELTEVGAELQFGVNHLGHFALTGLLIDMITKTPKARVVTVSSLAHRRGHINFDDLAFEGKYRRWRAYAQSKLANLLFAAELQRRLERYGHTTLSLAAHPGWTHTHLQVHSPLAAFLSPIVGMKPERGALPTLRAATDPSVRGGEYYGPDGFLEVRGAPVVVQPSAAARDDAVADQLWNVSEALTEVHFLSTM